MPKAKETATIEQDISVTNAAKERLRCKQCGGNMFNVVPVGHMVGSELNDRKQVVGGEFVELYRLHRCMMCNATYESEW